MLSNSDEPNPSLRWPRVEVRMQHRWVALAYVKEIGAARKLHDWYLNLGEVVRVVVDNGGKGGGDV